MKLILTHEVTGLGAPGDIVEVKDGYGRNFLIPRGFAIRWTRGGEKQVDSIKQARSARAVHDLDKAKQIKASLEGSAVDVPVRAGEGGRLFGAVTVTDIADAINRKVGAASTSGRSWSATRSSRSASTRSSSRCTTSSMRPSS
jgi:large subunit ribosomal protein L9